jgi:hypothetical protein
MCVRSHRSRRERHIVALVCRAFTSIYGLQCWVGKSSSQLRREDFSERLPNGI